MSVSYEQRCEVASKVRDVMGELATIRLDGVPLADLIEPSEDEGRVEANGGLEPVCDSVRYCPDCGARAGVEP